jgi:hypothetical protein
MYENKMANVEYKHYLKIKQCFHLPDFKLLASDITGLIQSCSEFGRGGYLPTASNKIPYNCYFSCIVH